MAALKEGWLQDVAASNRIGALRPTVVKALLPALEVHLRSLVEQAHKYMRRGKGSRMTVDDLNQALSQVGAEPLFGSQSSSENADVTNALQYTPVVNLLDIAKQALPPCPLQPELSMHWLAVDGVQPLVPENPRLLASAEQQAQLQLPKEMRQFYYRVTSILLAADVEDKTCRAVLKALRSDVGLQELLPHLSQFILREVKANIRSVQVLGTLMGAVAALWSNPALAVEFHLQQMLPAAFTCIIGAKLGASVYEDHWTLRAQSAGTIARVLRKFRALFPDLQARVCRT
jgi:transcription initiation factor TFIID subunit 6